MMSLTVAPTLGPTLGGYITDNYTWNWCFLINVPIGIVAVFFVMTFLHDVEAPSKSGRVDWLGIGLLAVGLGAMQYVLEEGERNDWFQDSLISTLAVISAVCLVTLVWWQLSRRNKSPVIDFRVLQNPTLSVCAGPVRRARLRHLRRHLSLFPLLAQTVLGFTSMQTGLALLPGGIATGVSILLCGAILNRPKPIVDIRWIIVSGTLVTMVSMWMLGHLSTESGTADTTLALLLRGLGTGLSCSSPSTRPPSPASRRANSSRHRACSVCPASSAARSASPCSRRSSSSTSSSTGSACSATTRHVERAVHPAPARPEPAGAGGARHERGGRPDRRRCTCWNRALMRQAMTMSYNDAFLVMLIVNLITLPAVLLLRRPKETPSMSKP